MKILLKKGNKKMMAPTRTRIFSNTKNLKTIVKLSKVRTSKSEEEPTKTQQEGRTSSTTTSTMEIV